MGKILQQRYKDSQLLKKVFRAIAKQCLECAGDDKLERKFCQCECELWPYRFGRDPKTSPPALMDKKNFVEGALFGFDKEAKECEKAVSEGSE
jgi:hypothetical protein